MAENSDDANPIKEELEDRFPDYSISGPIPGTYGEVWILSREGKISQAIKVIAPNKETGSSDEELEVFEREMALSFKIPPNVNVISIFGFVEPRIFRFDRDRRNGQFVPALRMKGMQGSLEDWTNDPSAASFENRLIAFVQGLSGLKHLYRNGFEGHGDIKPSNFLYNDFTSDFAIPEDKAHWPNQKYPYRVVVSDFGWSDAWIDLGEYKKVFRQYMAPERLDGVFHPEKSDVFSMGILLAELLLCRHPARNYKKATKSEGNWRRCCQDGNWDLEGIESERLRRLILESLKPSGEARISIDDLMGELCIELENYGVEDLLGSIKLFETHVYGDEPERHLAWAAHQIAELNEVEKAKARKELSAAIDKIKLTSILGFSKWCPLAKAILALEDSNSARVEKIRDTAADGLANYLSKKSHKDLSKNDFTPDLNYMRPFEAFSALASDLLDISGRTYEEAVDTKNFSSLVLAGLAFREAGAVRNVDMTKADIYLDECVRLAPEEATPHYFKAYWGWAFARTMSVLRPTELDNFDGPKHRAVRIESLHRALQLDPEWGEPKKLLKSFTA